MNKLFITSVLLLIFAKPALAKDPDFFPVSCDDLWSAVNLALSDMGNYRVMGVDDLNKHASFIVIGRMGDQTYTDHVSVVAHEGGCELKPEVSQIGADNGDLRGFRKRVSKAVVKIVAAKAPAPVKPVATAAQTAPPAAAPPTSPTGRP